MVRYMREFADFTAFHSLGKYALVLHALEGWNDDSVTASLHERSDTLLFLLKNAVRPEDVGLGGSLWQYAIIIGEDMIKKNRPVECAELLRLFLTHAFSRRALMTKKVVLENEIKDPAALLWKLKGCSIASESSSMSMLDVRSMGEELELLAFSNGPFVNVSHHFLDMVAKASSGAQNAPESRVRENQEDAFTRLRHLYDLNSDTPSILEADTNKRASFLPNMTATSSKSTLLPVDMLEYLDHPMPSTPPFNKYLVADGRRAASDRSSPSTYTPTSHMTPAPMMHHRPPFQPSYDVDPYSTDFIDQFDRLAVTRYQEQYQPWGPTSINRGIPHGHMNQYRYSNRPFASPTNPQNPPNPYLAQLPYQAPRPYPSQYRGRGGYSN